jgi:hypothetical protein
VICTRCYQIWSPLFNGIGVSSSDSSSESAGGWSGIASRPRSLSGELPLLAEFPSLLGKLTGKTALVDDSYLGHLEGAFSIGVATKGDLAH